MLRLFDGFYFELNVKDVFDLGDEIHINPPMPAE